MTVIDYCMNENNNDSYSCGGELYYKSQQPFSALIIFCMMANYTLLNMFFTLSDIVIRLKKSTIPDWYPSRVGRARFQLCFTTASVQAQVMWII